LTSASGTSTRARQTNWSALIGILITVVLLWWTLRDVSLREVWVHIRGVRPWLLLLTVFLATLSFPLRAIRWRLLLRLEGEALPLSALWHAVAIGFMANNVLPVRAGEFARAYAVRSMTGVRFTTAIASIVVERVLDGITLVALLAVGAWAGGFSAGTTIGGVTIGTLVRGAGVVFGALLVASLAVVRWPHVALGTATRAFGFVLPSRWSQRLTGHLEGLVRGLDGLRTPGRLAAVLLWSFAVWLTSAASFWTAFLAFGIDVPGSAALICQAIIAFGVAIPSSPGFFGPFEALVRVTLGLYGVAPEQAVSLAVAYHLSTFLPITLLGMWSLSRARLHLGQLRAAEEASGEPADGAPA
jgi:uncharacterized protein (TIRG00374 family)